MAGCYHGDTSSSTCRHRGREMTGTFRGHYTEYLCCQLRSRSGEKGGGGWREREKGGGGYT